MKKALVVYSTRTSQTRKIAELVAEGIRMGGMDADLLSAGEFEIKRVESVGYDAFVLGSATYHGEMMQSMKTFLFAMEKLNVEGKVGASFGAFGWSGEAPGRIFDTMRHILKMDMVGGPLMLKSASLGGGLKMAQDYGKEIATKAGGAS